MVVEPELPGRGLSDAGLADYVSVETLSTEGRHMPVAVTGRLALAPPFRERGGVMPAGLGQSDLHRVTELAVAALNAIGVSDGVSHVEIKLQADGASVIEVNGRLGGHVAWLWKRIGGGDLVALEIGAACRSEAAWPDPVSDVVAFRYLLPAPLTIGRVSAVSGVAQVRGLPGVELVQLRARPGTVVDWRQGSGSYVALISGATSTYAAMHRCIEQVESLVRIDLAETGEIELVDESRG
jgi:biotin carboxylase